MYVSIKKLSICRPKAKKRERERERERERKSKCCTIHIKLPWLFLVGWSVGINAMAAANDELFAK